MEFWWRFFPISGCSSSPSGTFPKNIISCNRPWPLWRGSFHCSTRIKRFRSLSLLKKKRSEGTSSSTMSPSPIMGKIRSSRMFLSQSVRVRPWPLSVPREPGKPPCFTCSNGSTKWKTGRSWSMGLIFERGISLNSGLRSGW